MRPISRAHATAPTKLPQDTLDAAKLPPCRLIDRAKHLIDERRYAEAQNLLSMVPLHDPDLKAAANLMIRSYCEMGQIAAAECAFSFASENGILASEGCSALILAYAKTDPGAADRVFSKAVESGMADSPAYNAIISASLQCDNFVKAGSLFEEAVDKGVADYHTYRLFISFKLGVHDLEAVKKLFRDALNAGHADEAMCLEIASLCKKRDAALDILQIAGEHGLSSESLEEKKKSLEIKPPISVTSHDDIVERIVGSKRKEATNCNRVIHHYISIGETEIARKIFDRASEQNFIDSPIYTLMLNEYRRIDDIDNAKQIFDAAARLGREDEGLYGIMASAYLDHGDPAQAKELLSQAQERWGSTTRLYDRLFNGYYEKGRYDDIISVVSGFPPEVQNNPSLVIWKMNAYRKKKLYALVILQADTLMARNGIEPDYLIRAKILKAYAMMHNWKPVEAFEILDRVLKELPSDNEHYCIAVCGLVFAYEDSNGKIMLEPSRMEEILRNLEPHRGRRNPNMNKDIEHARNYLIFFLSRQQS